MDNVLRSGDRGRDAIDEVSAGEDSCAKFGNSRLVGVVCNAVEPRCRSTPCTTGKGGVRSGGKGEVEL
jgi:hypothetical protein